MLSRRKWTEPSAMTTFAPPPWPLPYAPSRLYCKSRHGGLLGVKGPATSEGVSCQLIGVEVFLATLAKKHHPAIWFTPSRFWLGAYVHWSLNVFHSGSLW